MDDPELTKAETSRAAVLLTAVAKAAIAKLKREADMGWHYTKLYRYIDDIISKTITRECDKILKAAKTKPMQFDAALKAKETKAKARKELADELRSARNQLQRLKVKIRNADALAKSKVQKYIAMEWESAPLCNLIAGCSYPEVPRDFFEPTKEGLEIPARPGIYFLWNGSDIEYVGQSINMSQRLRLGNHHILREHHRISFLLFDATELTWAENYYIGALRAPLNYGCMASHARAPSGLRT